MLRNNLTTRLQKWFQQERRVLFTSGGVTVAIIVLRLTGLLQAWELGAFDLLFRLRPPEPMEDRILIVEINENDLKQVGTWPIPDGIMAELLYKINDHQPLAIGLDIYRDLPVEPGHEAFVEASQTIPNLIGIETIQNNINAQIIPPPILESKGQFGFNNLMIDPDNKVRRSLLSWYIDGKSHSSFALKLAAIYLQSQGIEWEGTHQSVQLGSNRILRFKNNDGAYIRADDGGYQILANFRHPNRFHIVSLQDVLNDQVDSEKFRDRLILIGSTAESLKDLFEIPYSTRLFTKPERISGVEVHANFISQILGTTIDGRVSIQVIPDNLEWLWILGWSWCGAVIIWKVDSSIKGLLNLLIAFVMLSTISYFAFLNGWWLPLIPPSLGIIGSGILIIFSIAYQKQELKRSKDFLQSVINTIPDPVFVKDQHYRWIILNQAFCDFIDYPLETLLGKSDQDFFSRHEADVFEEQDQVIFQTKISTENEETFTNAQGKTFLIATKRSFHQDGAGNRFLVGSIRDITERKRLENELRRTAESLSRSNKELKISAYYDDLTGLANRKHFHRKLQEALDWGQENQEFVGLLYLDLNGFKQINDTRGHHIGDLLLKAVAKRLKYCLRSSDTIARLGGDEFTVVLPGIKRGEDTAIVTQKIIETLCKPFMLESQNVSVGVSIGSSVYPIDGDHIDILEKCADSRMYQMKNESKIQHQLIGFEKNDQY